METDVDITEQWRDLCAKGSDTLPSIDRRLEFLESLLISDPRFVIRNVPDVQKLAEDRSYTRGIAYCKGLLGYGHYMVSSYDKALKFLHEGLTVAEGRRFHFIDYRILGTIALIHISLGNFNQAMEYGFKTRRAIQHLGDRVEEGWTLHGFGIMYEEMGFLDQAMTCYQEALAIFEEEGDDVGRARALTGIGCTYQAFDQLDTAFPYHVQSLELFRTAKNKIGEARALNDLGCVHHRQGDLDKALHLHQKSLALRRAVGNRRAQSTSLFNLGKVVLSRGEVTQAIAYLQEALTIAEEVKARKKVYETHEAIARAYERSGLLDEANQHYKAFYEIRHEAFEEEASVRLSSLQASFEVERAEKEAEIARLKNTELREKNERLEQLITELKATQSKLILAEKMASLGQLTAGIAHEIKNPLNFVNNFAVLSRELIDEMVEIFDKGRQKNAGQVLEEVEPLIEDLQFNASKINEHGQRADRIVRSMLEHARGQKDRHQTIHINAILKEYVRLAYHGMRAQDHTFTVEIRESYDPDLPPIRAIPHDLGRVFLNLINNAFYAMTQKRQAQKTIDSSHDDTPDAYRPVLSVQTEYQDHHAKIRITDNGPGIPTDIRHHIFDPFFTTKPSGEGTGLGLSLSYEIINNDHAGELYVDATYGEGSSFIIKLPFRQTDDESLPPGSE